MKQTIKVTRQGKLIAEGVIDVPDAETALAFEVTVNSNTSYRMHLNDVEPEQPPDFHDSQEN